MGKLKQITERVPSLFLRTLNRAELDRLVPSLEYRVYKKGSVIFKEGSLIRGLFYLENGLVKTFRGLPPGRRAFVSMHEKGEYFGYNPLDAKNYHLFTAVAMEDVVVAYINEKVFAGLIAGSSQLLQGFLAEKAKDCSKLYRLSGLPV